MSKNTKKERNLKWEDILNQILNAQENKIENGDCVTPTTFCRTMAEIHPTIGLKYLDLIETIVQNFLDNKIRYVRDKEGKVRLIEKGKKTEIEEDINKIKEQLDILENKK